MEISTLLSDWTDYRAMKKVRSISVNGGHFESCSHRNHLTSNEADPFPSLPTSDVL